MDTTTTLLSVGLKFFFQKFLLLSVNTHSCLCMPFCFIILFVVIWCKGNKLIIYLSIYLLLLLLSCVYTYYILKLWRTLCVFIWLELKHIFVLYNLSMGVIARILRQGGTLPCWSWLSSMNDQFLFLAAFETSNSE